MKTILEVYPKRQIVHKMPEDVYNLLVIAYDQAQRLSKKNTISFMIHELPIELRIKIKSQIINHIDETDLTYVDGADKIVQWGVHFDI